MESLQADFERVVKKQKLASERIGNTLDALIAEAKACEKKLSEENAMDVDEESDQVKKASQLAATKDALQPLARVANKSLLSQFSADKREYQQALSKFGKTIDKVMDPDLSMPYRATNDYPAITDFNSKILDKAVARHLYRCGRFALGDALVQEANIEDASELKDSFQSVYSIVEAIKQKCLEPAISWAEERRDELVKCGSSLLFQLYRLQFIHFLHQGKQKEALAVAKAHFHRFAATKLPEIQKLMGCFLFTKRLESSPYSRYFLESMWEDIVLAFLSDCCRFYGMPTESALYTSAVVGAMALPVIKKMTLLMRQKQPEWNLAASNELPVEVELGVEHNYHPIFTCPVSRQPSTADNPPMLLKCGHVICKQSLERLVKSCSNRLKCPYCPSEQTASRARPVFF